MRVRCRLLHYPHLCSSALSFLSSLLSPLSLARFNPRCGFLEYILVCATLSVLFHDYC
ncbi:unnamed protein product [Hymenolepis diminuta]|uniref:Uncharacterized protein n=1 Tax=Hymenolepis diminuta TaxID=6216 RepID=A0A564ZC67_HYMDI|nr:unnamed protein product [Hymenolepis diminuta]